MTENLKGFKPEVQSDSSYTEGETYFFGIGINAYEHHKKLNNAVKDIQDVFQLLKEQYGFEEEHKTFLLDQEATRKAILRQFDHYIQVLTSNDRLLIYYSGHGYFHDIDQTGYWVQAEAEKEDVENYIENNTIRNKIKNIKARHILLISDSCFSGSLLVRNTKRTTKTAFDKWEKDKSRWVFCSGKKEVVDGTPGDNSPFTASLLKVLDNNKEKLNIAAIGNEVTHLVSYNHEQQAEISALKDSGHEGGQFVFYKVTNKKKEDNKPSQAEIELAYKACKTMAEKLKFSLKYKGDIPDWIEAELLNEENHIIEPENIVASNPTIQVKPKLIGNIIEEVHNISFKMIRIDGGSFRMGGQGKDVKDDEKPAHKVQLRTFYLGETVVTQELWESLTNKNPSYFKGDKNLPVENISWNDTKTFINKLNSLTGKQYRLPTEAEWEYAARGGKKSEGYKYSGSNNLKEVGWFGGNSLSKTHPVSLKQPNELGLYDMSGNVWEWCEDKWHPDYEYAPIDGSAWVIGNRMRRIVRGGCWWYDASNCRVSFRGCGEPNHRGYSFGFRLALSAE